jgi:hypothetical protein
MPNITIVGTLSLLELIWLLVNVPGLFYSLANAVDARGDFRALRESGVATRKDYIIAAQRARHALIGAGLQSMFVAFGVSSALTPNPPQLTWLAYVISAVLVGGSALLSWGAFKDSIDRRVVRRPE